LLDVLVLFECAEGLKRRPPQHPRPGVQPGVVVVPEPAGEGVLELRPGRVPPQLIELLLIRLVRPLDLPVQPGVRGGISRGSAPHCWHIRVKGWGFTGRSRGVLALST